MYSRGRTPVLVELFDDIILDFTDKVWYTLKNRVKEYITMINILFICHGNICRSPMAEFVMKNLVSKAGLENRFHIESAATLSLIHI